MTPIDECPQIYRDLEFHVSRLHQLLAKPEPGLWSWTTCVANEVAGIAALHAPPVEPDLRFKVALQMIRDLPKQYGHFDGADAATAAIRIARIALAEGASSGPGPGEPAATGSTGDGL